MKMDIITEIKNIMKGNTVTQLQNLQNNRVPVVAAMLNVAGWPRAMGSGDISTPLTSTS